MRCFALAVGMLFLLLEGGAEAAESIPPRPARYFSDFANVTKLGTRDLLNTELENLEKQSSIQIVAAIFSKMASDSSIEDYTVRVASSWGVGQKGKNNGAALFVFIENRSLFIQTGYGLEGALPDALCKQIIETEIKPHFKNGNFDAGMTAGVRAMISAVKGEYKGTGKTAAQGRQGLTRSIQSYWPFLLFLAIFFLFGRGGRGRGRGYMYTGGGFGGFSGGSWGGGGGGSSSGGFSGGGGSFGGGGAGGRW